MVILARGSVQNEKSILITSHRNCNQIYPRAWLLLICSALRKFTENKYKSKLTRVECVNLPPLSKLFVCIKKSPTFTYQFEWQAVC